MIGKVLILAVLTVIIAYVIFGDVLVEKVYSQLSRDADVLLVYRTGSDKGTLITDPAEIEALQKSQIWTNFHLECCVGVPDFWVYAYQDDEPVSIVRGFDNPKSDAYNRGFTQRMFEMGQHEPNVYLTNVTIPSGVFSEDVASLLDGGMLLPQRREQSDARGPFLTATCNAFLKENPLWRKRLKAPRHWVNL